MKISSKAFAIPILTAYEQRVSSAHEQSVIMEQKISFAYEYRDIIEQKLALRCLLDAVK